MAWLCLCIGLLFVDSMSSAQAHKSSNQSQDAISAVEDLLERVLPGSRSQFILRLRDSCADESLAKRTESPCYRIADNGDRIEIAATGTSELTAALGFYLRNFCNMTIGWPRGGGSNIFMPKAWPKVGTPIVQRRTVPWSYMMNVCTHSYSLVWYNWTAWERFIDWMALSGINNVLALTGQEEVQYKVFRELGLSDKEIRGWFNGPAFLTWSRGQNEYGAGIAGPLPRSWMKGQWDLQRQILKRYRELGIVGQLPGFQGNVPIGLKSIEKDANITTSGATGWIDSLDPLYAKIADMWMKTLIKDFGTDHWYQLDGYLNGGTAPWLSKGVAAVESVAANRRQSTQPTLREADQPTAAADFPVAPEWYARGTAAYQGLNRTDPEAIWSFQGFSFEFWNDSVQHASWLKGFVDAVPRGRFSIVDMDYTYGEWTKWHDAAFFGAPFIWSALHNFGGTDGIKGNLSRVNEMPFAAIEAGTGIWGTGFTAEGIDQNPAYYDFLIEQPWRKERVDDIPGALVVRAHRRYGLQMSSTEVSEAWQLLTNSMYSQDVSVQDGTGVAHLPGSAMRDFQSDQKTPADSLCRTFQAWAHLTNVAPQMATDNEPFRYDLVNTGRDVLARLSTSLSKRFWDSMFPQPGLAPDAMNVSTTGKAYLDLLADLDKVVGTDKAFLLGSWLAWARSFGKGASDCVANGFPAIASCENFYEWNARVQVTTWNPTPKGASKVPGGPIDYAAKHWNGLIGDYYLERARRIMKVALVSASKKTPVDMSIVDSVKADWAYEWSTMFDVKYTEHPEGDAVAISQHMLAKYSSYFSSCGSLEQNIFV